jgi:hypothetical protein
MELDELADVPSLIKTVSSKGSGATRRYALSPTKIKTHFNTVKADSGEWSSERLG